MIVFFHNGRKFKQFLNRMVKIGNIELGEFPLLLAPMEDVSDPPFRAVCKANGVDMMYTEFISSEGLIRDAAKSVQKLDIFEFVYMLPLNFLMEL
jgi:tRNA-dihydrouridine synthase